MEKMITVSVTPEQHQETKILAAELCMSIKEIFWLGVEQAEKEKSWRQGGEELGDPPKLLLPKTNIL